MADKSIKITIATALNAAGFTAARRAISNLVSGTKDFASKVGGNLMNIKSGFDMVADAASKLMAAMTKGMEFERMTVTFKSLTGSMELAKAHMKDLQDLGRTPPFALEHFAAASQAMMKMTGGMAGFRNEMAIVGDMAAATGNDISTVGRAFGLAYQVIRDGQDFGRAGQQLYSLGIMTKKQVAEFAEMSKAGTDNMAVWERLMDVFGRYKGAMEATQKTAKGLTEAIQGEAQVAITDFSTAITETAKPALEGLLGYLEQINEDGTVEDWAESAVSSFERVKEGAEAVVGPILSACNKVWIGIKGLFESQAQGIGNFIGTLQGGGSLGDAWKARNEGVKLGWIDAADADGAEEEYIDTKKAKRAKEKSESRAAERAKTKAEAEKRIREDMAKAQAETTAKFEAEKQKAIEETMAKLREMAGVDAVVDVAVKVEEPKPVAVKVEEPKPVAVKVEEPKPVAVKVEEPKPVDVKVNAPDVVNVDVEEPDAVKIDVIEPKPVDIKVNKPDPVKVEVEFDNSIDAIEERFKTISESIKPDMSGVREALKALSQAKTDEEVKTAKANVDAEMKRATAESERTKRVNTKMRESEANAKEFVESYEKEKEETRKKDERKKLEKSRVEMQRLHDDRIKQIERERDEVQKKIDKAKDNGFDSIMATAGGGAWGNGTLNQAEEIQSEHQKKVGEQRAAKAEENLKKKMAKLGATLDDPSKLGRMSNLERAAFERLKLKAEEAKAAKLQKEREDREKQMVADLDAIKKKLEEVGL